ncbi:MAG: OmpA family protein [Desulfobacterales bacterium]|jgi:general secretion pathway protein A|nr:OmpA family protein [Desulfobacterales bacterium]
MYRSFYGLQHKPFQISSDPKFLWLGEQHQEALAILKYGILDNRGFLLLTGDVGTGKTTLINALVNSLGPDILVAHIPDPGLAEMDFFNYIASAFRMEEQFASKGAFLVRFRTFLEKAYTSRKQVLLIVDEAQRLGTTLLEEIRLLSNIELQQSKLINIFFVGQDEFNDILSRNENRALRQRMTLNYHIDPLSEEETYQFIRFRLKIAGTEKKIFTAQAASEIFSFSNGYPRLINILCDHALLTGYVKGITTLDAGIITECGKELRLPKRKADNPKPAMPVAAAIPAPLPAPAPAPQRHRSPAFIVSFFLLFILVVVFFYAYEQKDIWAALHRGIDRLAYVMTGELKQLDSVHIPPVATTPASEGIAISPLPAEKAPPVTAPVAPVPVPVPSDQTAATTVSPTVGSVAPVSPTPAHDAASAAVPAQLPAQRLDSPQPSQEVPVAVPEIESPLVVRFKFNANDLSQEAYETLNRLAAYLKAMPTANIIIKGYTDAYGSYGYNLSLSNFRANIVKNYLAGHGVDALRMTTLGLGSRDPMDTNETPAGRNANRRVEIEVQTP